MTDLGKNRFFSTLQTNGKRVINGDFMGISWDFMGFHGDISKLKPFFAKHWIVPSP
jgi:hypothetical protein